VLFYQTNHVTVRDSYFYTTISNGSQGYGIEWFLSDDNLVENNIMHRIVAPFMNGPGAGNVRAYNYTFDDYYFAASFMQAANYQHNAGINYTLDEGNDTSGFKADAVHGTSQFVTTFRNRFVGWETGKTAETNPVNMYSFNRFYNMIGNVLGQSGYHSTYAAVNDVSIYMLGKSPGSGVASDSLVATTMMRWGNYDTVTAGNKFDAAEVPSGLSSYSNSVPGDNNLPNSFYLAAKPSWYGSVTWPSIGPDVTGGNISNLGGHAYKIPARVCYESATKDGSGVMTNFDADVCYNGGIPPPPATPPEPKGGGTRWRR
jgi:hypothetical protein